MKANFYKIAACAAGILLAGSTHAQTIYTFAGSTAGFSGDGGPATAANLRTPAAIKYSSGEVHFVDVGNHRIRKISGGAYTISTFLGDGTSGFAGDGGPATSARINSGSFGGGIAFDNSNNMYYADILNHRIRKISSSGTVSTIAGSSSGFSGDGGPASAAQLSYPAGIAIDGAGNIYVADQGNHRLRKIDAATGNISTIAGTGVNDNLGDGGPATSADLSYPYGVAVDASGNIYFGRVGGIRKITAATGIVSAFASVGSSETPAFMEVDQAGNLFVGTEDTYGRLYKVTPSGTVTTVAGNGGDIAAGDGGPATAAAIGNCAGVTVTATGSVLITSKNNHRIRIITPATATITGTATMCAGATTTLTASIPGAAWISGNTGVATVSATGLVTGVTAGTATITYVAGLIFGTQVVTVNAPVTPAITASGATLSVPASYASYQWSLGGTPVAGATNATYNAIAPGTYAVAVTNAAGCGATSANYVLSSVSVATLAKPTGLQIFPNPSHDGRFSINVPGQNNGAINIIVVNVIGEKVYETSTQTNTPVTIKLNVPAGIYTVRAVSNNTNYHASIMVN